LNRRPPLAVSLDPAAANALLEEIKVPEKNRKMALSRLETILQNAKLLQGDLAYSSIAHYLQETPRLQRKAFIEDAENLEKIADRIRDFSTSRRRALEHPEEGIYIVDQVYFFLRTAIANNLKEILDPKFVATFGVEPIIWPETDEVKRSLNIENMSLAIAAAPVDIAESLFRAMAQTFRNIANSLSINSKKGRSRPDLVRNLILLNIVALWRDIFQGERGLYFDDRHPSLLEFAERVCGLFGVRSMASAYHLKAALRVFRRKRERILFEQREFDALPKIMPRPKKTQYVFAKPGSCVPEVRDTIEGVAEGASLVAVVGPLTA
jgi:hypothetical protein